MIKTIAAISATALLLSCEGTSLVRTETETVTDTIWGYKRDTIIDTFVVKVTTHHRDTVYLEYDHYKADTVRMIVEAQGRYVFTNYYDGQDTLIDYVNTKDSGIVDTFDFSSTRWVSCTHYDPDGRWDKIKFKYEMEMLRDGRQYHIRNDLATSGGI